VIQPIVPQQQYNNMNMQMFILPLEVLTALISLLCRLCLLSLFVHNIRDIGLPNRKLKPYLRDTRMGWVGVKEKVRDGDIASTVVFVYRKHKSRESVCKWVGSLHCNWALSNPSASFIRIPIPIPIVCTFFFFYSSIFNGLICLFLSFLELHFRFGGDYFKNNT